MRVMAYDVILCNTTLPGLDGLEFLRQVRLQDLDIPVVLTSDTPNVATAVRALEYGAYRYLASPVQPEEVRRRLPRRSGFTSWRVRAGRRSRCWVEATTCRSGIGPGWRRGSAGARGPVHGVPAGDPLVGPERVGYEALLRTREPTMNTPQLFLEAAERLKRVVELGRTIRKEVARRMSEAPAGAQLFVNVHASDLLDEQLWSPAAPLSPHAGRVVLELTERASFDQILGVSERVAALRKLGFRIGIDDLGAGYAGLSTLSQLRPEIVKIDMSLIRGIERDPVKRSIVASITQLCKDLNILVVSEGIETTGERDSVAELGGDYMQGFLFGRPIATFDPPRF